MGTVEEPSGGIDLRVYSVDSKASAMDGVCLCFFINHPFLISFCL